MSANLILESFQHKEKFYTRENQNGKKIKYFNPLKILLIGKSGCGKSYILRDLMTKIGHEFEFGIVISGTEFDNKPFYSQFIPRMFIYGLQDVQQEGFFDQKIFNIQQKLMDKHGYEGLGHVFILMDDCVSSTKWLQRDDVSKLLFEGRHYKITLVIAIQYDKLMPPKLRNNFDFIILPNTQNVKFLKSINDEYINMDDNFTIWLP
ncbi:poxvirus A32 protein (macronuclear) [Tetrahymena thermophila SB210]|uniref:Poxvirus A32 protein n=1 Tax=Tetrahymena thermophila (strain SB210) TaxID=312017 RepID=W7X198_TETTS|nr:poxvirus A32 protein [Tetrahymena thermophila SB210]EWS71342.1 poxvirus A32 protein [Tetrahymena thermophila SB210]|eukprot:XP_012656116.1 poxvirus A32 protein [Tetrahymena thermophila SB210]